MAAVSDLVHLHWPSHFWKKS